MGEMRLVAALCFFLTAFTVLVEARYQFKVGILSFQNPSNTDSNGLSCDIGETTCEYTFRFCLSPVPGNVNCVLGSTITGSSYIVGSPHTFTLGQPLIPNTAFSNPIVYRATDVISSGAIPWTINYDFRIQIEDYDVISNDLVDRIILQSSIRPSDGLVDATYTGTFNKVSMRVQLQVVCLDNFYGDNCFTECVPSNDATGYYSCDNDGNRVCLDGYTGLPNCLDNSCSPACVNGDCIGPNTCSCSIGWTGTACDVCILDQNCPADRATCTVPGECECIQGYSGLLCQNDDDVCGHTSPCANDATCNNAGSNDYTCTCPSGYTGDTCSEEVDACVVDADAPLPCQNGGTCTATGPGTFNCTCMTGWTGSTCNTNINECSPTPPCVQGSCTDCTPTGPILSDPTNPNFVFCPNGYICECPEGFFGDNCEVDVDACEPMPCQNGGMCVDVVGGPGYTCVCPSGYTGLDCDSDIDECASTPGLCRNGGTCTNGEGYYNCSCPNGFQGTNCEIDIDECLTANCVENNTRSCLDGSGNFTCQCRSGYTGTLCDEEVDLCEPHPCNNGNCTKSFNDFSCSCFTGFTGVECDMDIDYCTSPDVCLNGGTCVDGLTTYTCECPSLFTGQQCETSFNPCEAFPCGGGQGCVIEDNSYICEDCTILAESSTTPFSGCTPSIIDPGAAIGTGNNTTPDNVIVIGGVVGGLVGAVLLLLLVIAIIVCCVRFCACCLSVKETETESDYQTLPRNAAQHNPLYLGTSTLLSNVSGTLRSAYGTTTPRVESPTHRNDPTYERLGDSSSSNEDNLGPLQNPMYALSQVALEKSGGYQAPNVPPGNSSGVYLTDNVSYLPVTGASNGHYETIPALQNGQQPVFVASGKYDSLTEKTPAKESSFMKSGKYDSLAPAPPINKQTSAGSLASTAEVPPSVENPYVLSPSRGAAPELTMAPSVRGDDYAMLPPMTAFASLKEEAKSEKKKKTTPQETVSEHKIPAAKENPYEFS